MNKRLGLNIIDDCSLEKDVFDKVVTAAVENHIDKEILKEKKMIGMMSSSGRSILFDNAIVAALSKRGKELVHINSKDIEHVDFLKELEKDITESMYAIRSTPHRHPLYHVSSSKDIRNHDLNSMKNNRRNK